MATKDGPSLADVAQLAGVSTTTASMVLRGRWREFRIAASTRDQVLGAAEQLQYVPRRARAPRPERAALWLVFAPVDLDSGPTAGLLRGIQAHVRQEGLAVEAVVFPYERGRLQDKAGWAAADFAAGAVLVGTTADDLASLDPGSLGVPAVVVNRTAHDWPSVATDDYEVGALVLRHFRARQLTSVAVVAPDYAARSQSLRVVGFADAWAAAGGAGPDAVPVRRATNDSAGGRAAALELVPLLQGRSGVFVLNGSMVGGVLQALHERGLRVPEDVEVVSYGDGPVNELLRPSVTSVAVPIEQMGRDAARLLQRAAEQTPDIGRTSVTLPVHLVLRDSSPAPAPLSPPGP